MDAPLSRDELDLYQQLRSKVERQLLEAAEVVRS